MTSVLHHLFVLVLIIAFPIWDWYETRRLKTSTDPRDRIRAYRLTIAWQLVAVALLLATVPLVSLFTAPTGERLFGRELDTGLAVGVVVGLLAGAMLPVLLALRDPEARAKQAATLQRIAFFLPRTGEERRWFAALSVVVGVCEEIIFRGFLVRYMMELPFGLGLGGAVLAAAVVFGIDHGYQGWTGLLSTTLLALVMSALFLGTGSLWLPMLVHALIDLRVLLLLRRDDSMARVAG